MIIIGTNFYLLLQGGYILFFWKAFKNLNKQYYAVGLCDCGKNGLSTPSSHQGLPEIQGLGTQIPVFQPANLRGGAFHKLSREAQGGCSRGSPPGKNDVMAPRTKSQETHISFEYQEQILRWNDTQ